MKLPMCSYWSKLFNFMSLSPKYAQTTPCSAQITLVTFSASLSSIVEPIAICFVHASCTSPFSASLMLLDLALVIGPLGIFKGSFKVDLSSCWISSQKLDWNGQNPNLCFFLVLKRAIGLKTSYVQAFGKLLVFVDQMYHTLENNVTKTQILDWNGQNPNLCYF